MTSKKHKKPNLDDLTESPQDAAAVGRFNESWQLLAKAAVCDELDSPEYCRVLRAWFAARRPEPLVSYIRREANRPAEGSA